MTMSPRDRLRRDTRATHDALENLPIMLLLMSPLVTRESYVALLSQMYAAFSRYCPHIVQSLGTLAHEDLSPAQLPAFLERDLRDLDHWPVPVDTRIPLPTLHSELEALGAWYVLEGSALGGEVIGSRLRSVLGDDLPICYLAGRDDGAEPSKGNRWQRFDDYFESHLRDAEALAAVTAGANASYRYTEAVMAAADS